ncbi:LEF-8 [Dikerogammarus haemobaphes nudivirus]|nr:LEF-8 [Dikerogammarus haemobaphes nudivirus]
MGDFYANFLVKEYNACFAPYIIFDCKCYEIYENFKEFVYEKSKSYLCCLLITIEGKSKEFHLKWPVMLGSLIDFNIRGVQNDSNMFGSMIIEGSVKVIYNFITNNLTAGHVYREKKNAPIFKVKVKVGNQSINLIYDETKTPQISSRILDDAYEQNEKIKNRLQEVMDIELSEAKGNVKDAVLNPILKKDLERQKRNFDSTYQPNLENTAEHETWIKFLNSNNPFDTKSTEEEYIEYFQACLKGAPQLDELANKTCMSVNSILLKVLESLINKVKTTKGPISARLTSMGNKLTSIIKNGNMFFVLSSKMDVEVNVISDFKTIYQTIDPQKLHLTSKLTSIVKRSVSTCTINSKALLYPNDGAHFTCPIDTKDIKGAGENVSLAQLVISAGGMKISISMLKAFFTTYGGDLAKRENEEDSLYVVVINSFITKFRVARTNLIKIKRKCVILSFMVYDDKFLVINTKGRVLMKYSLHYNFFVTPYEYTHFWPDAFDGYPDHLKYNPCSQYFNAYMDLAQPAKRNVTNLNIKGRCNVINNLINLTTFIHAIGASNSAIVHRILPTDEIVKTKFTNSGTKFLKFPINLKNPHLRYLKFGVGDASKHPPMNDNLKKLYEIYKPIDDKTEQTGVTWNQLIPAADKIFERIFKQLDRWYTPPGIITIYPSGYGTKTFKSNLYQSILEMLYEQQNSSTNVEDTNETTESEKQIMIKSHYPSFLVGTEHILKEYQQIIKFDCDATHAPHMFIYVAFGDFKGGTNEDGIVIDKKLCENGPKKLVTQTLNVRFSEHVKVLKKDKVEVNSTIYTPINKKLSNVIFYGVLESGVKLSVIKSKNIKIVECHVGDTFRYLIVSEALSNYDMVIESIFYKETQTVNIHFRYFVPLGIGTKISNLHGQKGIISKVADLSNIVAYQRDGTVIHPQLLFSVTSVVGRTISSQIMSMYTQEGIGFTTNFEVVAPQGINVHHIEASCKSKKSKVKNDLMTSENGFVANNLTFTAAMLNKQNYNRSKHHPVHIVQQLLGIQGSSFNFLTFKQNIVDIMDPEENNEDDDEEDGEDEEDSKITTMPSDYFNPTSPVVSDNMKRTFEDYLDDVPLSPEYSLKKRKVDEV